MLISHAQCPAQSGRNMYLVLLNLLADSFLALCVSLSDVLAPMARFTTLPSPQCMDGVAPIAAGA